MPAASISNARNDPAVKSGVSSKRRIGLGFCRAGFVALVEDDAPLAGVLQPPDRCESGDQRSLGVANRTGAYGQGTGVEYLDVFGLPRERRIRALVVTLPPVSDLLRASKRLVAREEDRLLRQE